MPRPLHRTYEMRGDPPSRYLQETGRVSQEELASWGYVQTDTQPWGVSADQYHDRATLWSTKHGARDDMWVGDAFDGCSTCGCPEYEHAPGVQRFSVTMSVAGDTATPTNARVACEHFR